MKYLVFLIAFVILWSVGQVLTAYLPLFRIGPNMFLILTMIFAFDEQNFHFLIVSLGGGLFMDIALGFPVGAYTLSLLIAGLVMHIVSEKIHGMQNSIKFLPLSLIISVILVDIWLYLYILFCNAFKLTSLTIHWQALQNGLVWQIVYALLLLIPVYGYALLIQRVLLLLEQRKKGSGLI